MGYLCSGRVCGNKYKLASCHQSDDRLGSPASKVSCSDSTGWSAAGFATDWSNGLRVDDISGRKCGRARPKTPASSLTRISHDTWHALEFGQFPSRFRCMTPGVMHYP